ncbi:MAG: DNA primase [Lachnospiraceae bacterium]|nr:DNA primase [Lachnospiraceae bacterium]
MRFSDEFLEEVKSRNDIADVVGSYIPLKKKGNNYWGLCPFHNEKTPSFSVYPPKQMYHCFGCGEGGGVINFVMKYENASFAEAVKILAERAGMEVKGMEETGEEKAKRARGDVLRQINSDAALFFMNNLYTEHGKKGLDYLKNRGLSDETIRHFGLGFAGNNGRAVVEHLRKKGYSDELIIASGIATNSETYGMSSSFFGRVMFPIINTDKKVIGFGGRVLGSGEPKYLNTSETPIFDKRRNLYGYNFAKRARKKYYILCEGYMDVISMHQAGFDSAIASLGTAFTEEQAAMIKRDGCEVYLAYDMDEAGEKAALKAVRMLTAVGITPKRISMKPCKDPDEFLTKNGRDEFGKRLDEAENGFLYIEDRVRESFDLSDPEERYKCERQIVENLWMFAVDEVRMNSYAESVVKRYGYTASEVSRLLDETRPREYGSKDAAPKPSAYSPPKKPVGKKKENIWTAAESSLLTWVTDEPEIYSVIRRYLNYDDFSPGSCRTIAQKAFEMLENGTYSNQALFDDLQDEVLVSDATGILQNSAPDIDTSEKRMEMLKDLIIRVMERSCEILAGNDDPEKELKIFNRRLEIDKLKSGKLRMHDEEEN